MSAESISTNATVGNLPGPGYILGRIYNPRLRVRLERPFDSSFCHDTISTDGSEVSTIKSISSVSTDATADNLPGPGRIVGNIYGSLGVHIERRFNSSVRHETVLAEVSEKLTMESISTNATADNLPGPGRILGNIYGFLGVRLERQLGRLADKMGYGPRATAIRIQRRRGIINSASFSAYRIKVENKKLEEDCKRMLKYAGSEVIPTSKQALDHITDLAFRDQHVQGLLNSLGALRAIRRIEKQSFIWYSYDGSLLSSSRKALVSLADTEITVLGHKLIRLQAGIFTSECPVEFEWDQVDDILNTLLKSAVTTSAPMRLLVKMYDSMLEFIICHANKLPKTTSSETFQWIAAFDTTEDIHDHSHAIHSYHLLIGIASRDDSEFPLHFQPDSLEYRRIFRVDLPHLQALYPHPVLHPLLSRLACRPDAIMCQILNQRRGSPDRHITFPDNTLWVLPYQCLTSLSWELARYADHEDDLLRNRTRYHVRTLLSVDRYCRSAILKAISATQFSKTLEYKSILECTKQACTPTFSSQSQVCIYRHCDDDGNLVHIVFAPLGPISAMSQQSMQDDAAATAHQLNENHHALLAGHSTQGDNLYVACDTQGGIDYPFAISEGEQLSSFHTKKWKSDGSASWDNDHMDFAVYVLSYEPETYAPISEDGQELLDSTGPYSWQPVEVAEWDEWLLPLEKRRELEGLYIM
ncbi:hypothetical protein EW145_g3035 [Phellinidium pouzarii]|uniref:Uncharacterized protein n=1 Tax=Phellinidium pouzarii TaxID=167371 RepID=A0A4S4L941_9AGAM|nr:hypothetical protein EW145_g3035 [Phellinidium pouzarii]